MGQLTTHVLDTVAGLPAAGVRIELHGSHDAAAVPLGATTRILSVVTGQDGRCASPLLAGGECRPGRYVLSFHVADYFRARGIALPAPAFIDIAVIAIGIADADQHYHVPLLISPWSYSVYRGG